MTENRRRSSRLSKGSNDGEEMQFTEEDLKARIVQLEDEINDHVKEENRQHDVIVSLTEQLSEKELLISDSNKKIDELTTKIDTVTPNKVKICLFTDSVTENLTPDSIIPEGLKSTVKIVKEITTYSFLSDQVDSGRPMFTGGHFDLIVLALGGEDIIRSENSDDLVAKAMKVVSAFTEFSKLVIVATPPNNVDRRRAEPRVFNKRLESKVKTCNDLTNSVQFINTESMSKRSYKDILIENKVLSDQGVSLLAHIIRHEVKIPEPGSITSKVPQSSEDFFVALCKFPSDKSGLFLGSRGMNASNWWRKHGVKVSVGKWFERDLKQENQLAKKSKFEGALVSGPVSGIKAVFSDSKNLVTKDPQPENQNGGAKKFKYF